MKEIVFTIVAVNAIIVLLPSKISFIFLIIILIIGSVIGVLFAWESNKSIMGVIFGIIIGLFATMIVIYPSSLLKSRSHHSRSWDDGMDTCYDMRGAYDC